MRNGNEIIVATNDLTDRIIGAAMEVHRVLGPGLLERTYEDCLAEELRRAGLAFERQKALPVIYKGRRVGQSYRLDLLVDDRVIVEVKALKHITDLEVAQVLTYLKLSGHAVGLILNFASPLLRDGIRRVVLNYREEPDPLRPKYPSLIERQQPRV